MSNWILSSLKQHFQTIQGTYVNNYGHKFCSSRPRNKPMMLLQECNHMSLDEKIRNHLGWDEKIQKKHVWKQGKRMIGV